MEARAVEAREAVMGVGVKVEAARAEGATVGAMMVEARAVEARVVARAEVARVEVEKVVVVTAVEEKVAATAEAEKEVGMTGAEVCKSSLTRRSKCHKGRRRCSSPIARSTHTAPARTTDTRTPPRNTSHCPGRPLRSPGSRMRHRLI